MRHRRLLIRLFIVALYVFTWIGGWRCHAREMAAYARYRYDHAVSINALIEQHPTENGHPIKLSTPFSGVEWCIPVIPGVCLANSYYGIGPLSAAGTIKLVLYYVGGSITVCHFGGWYA